MKKIQVALWSAGAVLLLVITGVLMMFAVMVSQRTMTAAAAVAMMILVAYFVMTASALFEQNPGKVVMNVFVTTIPIGFCFYWAAGAFPAWGVILGALCCAVMIYMIVWWSQEGSAIKEFLLFVVIDCLLAFIGESGIARITDLAESRWVIGLLTAIPWIILVMSIGYFLFDIIKFKEELKSEDFDPSDYLEEVE